MSPNEQGMNNIYLVCAHPTDMGNQLKLDIQAAFPGRAIHVQPVAREQSKFHA